MNEARAKRILDELQKQGVSQMLLTDPMSIYYLTGVSMAPIERFYALLLRADGHHAYFLNHLFHVPQEVGVEPRFSSRCTIHIRLLPYIPH